jgi:hypothetical protein
VQPSVREFGSAWTHPICWCCVWSCASCHGSSRSRCEAYHPWASDRDLQQTHHTRGRLGLPVRCTKMGLFSPCCTVCCRLLKREEPRKTTPPHPPTKKHPRAGTFRRKEPCTTNTDAPTRVNLFSRRDHARGVDRVPRFFSRSSRRRPVHFGTNKQVLRQRQVRGTRGHQHLHG